MELFIAGASGFVGGHLVEEAHSRGIKIRCLVRSERAASYLASKGVETAHGDITSAESLKGAIHEGDFVVHLVGIIQEKGKSTFQRVHVEGTANLLNEAKRAGAGHFFYQSALGADGNSWSGYLRTKAEAEESVRGSGLDFTIFRPSLIIGPWDGFTKKILQMIKLSPVIPIPGEGKTKFQPLYIKDWLKCLDAVLKEPGKYRSTFEIGGPEHLTYRDIVDCMAAAANSRKPVIPIPMGLIRLSAGLMQMMHPSPPVTSDQLRLLEQDNICDADSIEKFFNFEPVALRDALKEFIR